MSKTITIQMTRHELEQVERLRQLRRKSTRTGAIRSAISLALFLAEAEEQKRRLTLTDADGKSAIVHFVM